jgi:AraC-like DNA-binding protein
MRDSHDHAFGLLARPSLIALQEKAPTAADVMEEAPLCAEPGSDPLSDVLRMVKLTGALFFLVDASSPWGIEVPGADAFAAIILPRAQHVVSYHIVLKGSGWVRLPDVPFTRFEAGDVLVIAHGDGYSMLSAPDQTPEFDRRATLQFFRDMAAGKLPFVVKEGGGGVGGAQFVCGYLGCDMQPFNPLLTTLPRLLQVKRATGRREGLLDRLIELTLAEAQEHRVGGASIRLRLSELMFVEVIRRHLETLPAGQTGWLSGLRDPAISRVLSMLHERPARSWTLRELAAAAGMSRAALAGRFAQLVGCPPMRYLMLWRMQIAARLLADGAVKVAAVAHDVGYESEAAFSRVFKKVAGLPPAAWRTRHEAGGRARTR